MGFIICYFIIFFKGFIRGIAFSLLLKANGLASIGTFINITLPEIIIITPLFWLLAYHALATSFNGGRRYNYGNKEKYLNQLIYITIGIIFYAVIITVTNHFINQIG